MPEEQSRTSPGPPLAIGPPRPVFPLARAPIVEWIFHAVATQSTRAFDALLPGVKGAIGNAGAWATAGGLRAILLIEEGFLSAHRSHFDAAYRGCKRDKSYKGKTHSILP